MDDNWGDQGILRSCKAAFFGVHARRSPASFRAMNYHEELVLKFRTVHGCEAQFLYSIPVQESFENSSHWQGAVWLFKLTGHPKAKFGYAWLHPNSAGDDLEVTTVL